MSVVISRLIGGLGNQMFQYAVGRVLSLKRGVPLWLDTRPLQAQAEHTPRSYALGAFDIRAEVPDAKGWQALTGLTGLNMAQVQEQGPRFMPEALQAQAPVCLHGYWQSERYIRAIRPVLQLDFKLRQGPSAEMLAWAQRMRSSSESGHASVMLHVRRGDYVSLPSAAAHHGLCSLSYYEQALQALQDQHGPLEVFAFSDDPAWVAAWAAQALKPLHACHVVSLAAPNDRPAEHDLWLMQQCQHHIIANSSYSWWAAWLGQRSSTTVIAPKAWMKAPGFDDTDLIPSNWLRL